MNIRKIVYKHWAMSLLAGLVLFIAYRITVMNIADGREGFLATLLYFFDVVLNLGFSFLYLVAILFCSLTIFLNLIEKIRNQRFLSWLSFSGVPAVLLVGVGIHVLATSHALDHNVMARFLLFLLAYAGATSMIWLRFRKTCSRCELSGSQPLGK